MDHQCPLLIVKKWGAPLVAHCAIKRGQGAPSVELCVLIMEGRGTPFVTNCNIIRGWGVGAPFVVQCTMIVGRDVRFSGDGTRLL